MSYDTQFLEDLASAAPTPGGGGASAYVGALAAALSSMVGNLTVGKKTYASVEGEVKKRMETLEALRLQLFDLIQADADAFEPLAASYRMPKETEEEQAAKEAALQAALRGACMVPLRIMSTCCAVLAEADYLANNGSKLAVSDAGASAVLARAAVHAASLNVYINTKCMADKEMAAQFEEQADWLIEMADKDADRIYAYVLEKIRG